ncbi:hypothetical protein CAC42_4535 [Sphaceloma murrayae]|uniref:Uncharacterized protein n=1 Tax=Sphaceloma murrayae TaxID=2082308 RepID=A0A2K1QLU9_9PEZI|nr:hypothetical protein CAC42_4535 [Sphaceloma murrayae]
MRSFTTLIFLLLSIATSVFAADTCTQSDDVYNLQKQVYHVHAFCKFYNSSVRKKTPINDVTPKGTREACVCELSVEEDKTSRIMIPTGFVKETYPAPCRKADVKKVLSSFGDFTKFCNFYTTGSGRTQNVIPGLSPKRTVKACECIAEYGYYS